MIMMMMGLMTNRVLYHDDDGVIDDHLVGPGRVAEPSTEEEWGIGQIQT